MKAYQVRSDIQNYQFFAIDRAKHPELDPKPASFSGKPIGQCWRPPPVFIYRPMRLRPDFWWLEYFPIFAVEEARNPLQGIFAAACERLPLAFDNHDFIFMNIKECPDALDIGKCEYGPSALPKKYVFRGDRITTSLFKIPQTAVGQILCAEWDGDPEREFKAAVESKELTGVRFKLLWDSETDSPSRPD